MHSMEGVHKKQRKEFFLCILIFRKTRNPILPILPSFLSEKQALPILCGNFWRKNPAFGTLLFQVTGGQGAVPIERATVVISKALPNGHTLSVTTMTNESGKTAEISLPAPRRDKSQTPGGTDVFATYDALISAPGTVPVVVHDIPIFDGITTIQPVALSFDVSGARRDEAESITDTEPNL